MDNQADVVVIGLGPGGEALASDLAGAGLKVVGIDRHLVGGECPYYGCIPSKMMIRAADLLAEGRRIDGIAGQSEVNPNWEHVAMRISSEATSDWDDQVAVERLEEAGVRFVRGHGRLVSSRAVEVDGERYTARKAIVLNTGTEPAVPPIDGLADTPFWTNRDAVRADELPESMVVIGGGAIGAELCQVFARFGVRVTLLEVADRILPPEEPEASELLQEVFEDEGIRVLTGVDIARVTHDGEHFSLKVDGENLTAERLLVAAGRRTNLRDLGLDTAGLDPHAASIVVDERMRAAEGVWAIGDITGRGAFTHMSMYQAKIAARDIRGEEGPAAEYRAIPRVTFTDPEVGSVGMTEQQARDQGLKIRVGSAEIPSTTRGWIHKAGNEGLVKLIEDSDRGVLVGATVVGPNGGEVLSALVVAVHAQVPTDALRTMIYAYPTFHRAIETAVDDLS